MIGGYDISVPGPVEPWDIDLLFRGLRAVWPHAVLETGDGQKVLTLGAAIRAAWPGFSEFFVYEDQPAYESWTAVGLTDQNADTMIGVTVESDSISFVVSALGSPTSTTVSELIEAVKENRRLAHPVAA